MPRPGVRGVRHSFKYFDVLEEGINPKFLFINENDFLLCKILRSHTRNGMRRSAHPHVLLLIFLISCPPHQQNSHIFFLLPLSHAVGQRQPTQAATTRQTYALFFYLVLPLPLCAYILRVLIHSPSPAPLRSPLLYQTYNWTLSNQRICPICVQVTPHTAHPWDPQRNESYE